ncbi:hypothetical protein, partial [Streptosporangium sp. NPDC002524]|uniref:hypothetical protein n=1 Tax=Streptosporangium sp. NPDC002524 TaxID=3154537 RepID=UPI00332AF591
MNKLDKTCPSIAPAVGLWWSISALSSSLAYFSSIINLVIIFFLYSIYSGIFPGINHTTVTLLLKTGYPSFSTLLISSS